MNYLMCQSRACAQADESAGILWNESQKEPTQFLFLHYNLICTNVDTFQNIPFVPVLVSFSHISPKTPALSKMLLSSTACQAFANVATVCLLIETILGSQLPLRSLELVLAADV